MKENKELMIGTYKGGSHTRIHDFQKGRREEYCLSLKARGRFLFQGNGSGMHPESLNTNEPP